MISSKYVECEYCVKSMSSMVLAKNTSNVIPFSTTYLEASCSATKSQKCCRKLSRCELKYTIPFSGKFSRDEIFADQIINFADQRFLLAMSTLGSSVHFVLNCNNSYYSHCHSNRLFISGALGTK